MENNKCYCGGNAVDGELCKTHHIAKMESLWTDNSELYSNPGKGIIAWARQLMPEYCRNETPSHHILLYDKMLQLYHPDRINKYQRLLELIAYRGSAKCLSENTLVTMDNGLQVKLKDVKIGDKIKSLNKYLKFESDTIIDKIHSGNKKVYTLKTKSGDCIDATMEHKILTFDGWKKLKDITIEDYIATPREVNVDNPEFPMSDEEIKFLTYMIAEGALSSRNCKFTNADTEVISDMSVCCEKLGFIFKQSGKPIDYAVNTKENNPRELLRKYNLYGHTAHTKRLPKQFFLLSNRQKWLIINSFMVTDGFFTLSKGKGGITLCNKKLVDDLRVILYQLGVITYSWYKKAGYNGNNNFHSYTLEFGDISLEKVINNCNLLQKRNKAIQCLTSTNRYSLLDVYPKVIKKYIPKNINSYIYKNNIAPSKYSGDYQFTRNKIQDLISDLKQIQQDQLFPETYFEKLENADVFWNKVESITFKGIENTYDISVMNNHNFISNNLITHNSTAANTIFVAYILAHNGQTIKIKDYEGKIVEVKIQEKFVCLLSETGTMAEDFSVRIRDEFGGVNELLSYYYSANIEDAVDDATGVWTKKNFKFNGCYVVGIGAGQQVRGKVKGAYRPTCHAAGTKVWYNDRLVNIEDTDWNKIIQKENTLGIKLNGIPSEEKVTLDHKYYAIKRDSKNKIYSFDKPEFIESQNLTLNHYIGTPIDNTVIEIPKFKVWKNKGKEIIRDSKGRIVSFNINKEKEYYYETPKYFYSKNFWWFLGLWFGDGTLAKRIISIACTKKYPAIIERLKLVITEMGKKYHIQEHENHVDIRFSYTSLAEYLYTLKEGNSIKQIPLWIQQGQIDLIKEFVKGYIDSDGFIDINNNQIRITSVNYETLLNFSYMLARLNIPSSIRNGMESIIEKFNIKGKIYFSKSQKKYDIMFNQNCEWINSNIKNPKRINGKSIIIKDDFIWRRISSISENEITDVVKVQLNEGHSKNNILSISNTYLTPFGLSHNCMIYDDIYSEKNTVTEESREKMKNWFHKASFNSLDDLMGKCVVLGTIVHEDTVLCELKKNTSWHSIEVPIMNIETFHEFIQTINYNQTEGTCKLPFDTIESPEIRGKKQKDFFDKLQKEKDWKLTWSDRHDLYFIALKFKEHIENNSLDSFYQEYFHITSAPGERKFQKYMFQKNLDVKWRYTNGTHWIYDPLEGEWVVANIELSLDTAAAQLKSDFSVITVGAFTASRKIYILNQFYGRWSMRDSIPEYANRSDLVCTDRSKVDRIGFIDELYRVAMTYNPTKIKIGIAGTERNYFTEAIRVFRINDNYCQIVADVQTVREGRKEERIISRCLPFYEALQIYHCFDATNLEYQLEYLGKTKNDDAADSLSGLFYQPFFPQLQANELISDYSIEDGLDPGMKLYSNAITEDDYYRKILGVGDNDASNLAPITFDWRMD